MYSMPWNTTVKAHGIIEQLSAADSLQVIFGKLWNLWSKADESLDHYFAKKQGRTIFSEKTKIVNPNR